MSNIRDHYGRYSMALLCIVLSCSPKGSEKTKLNCDTTAVVSPSVDSTSGSRLAAQTHLQRLVLGSWWVDSTDPSSRFSLYSDSTLYDTELDRDCRYLITGDSITISCADGNETWKMRSLSSRVMVWKNREREMRLFKWNPK
jgi:hypothetical protein